MSQFGYKQSYEGKATFDTVVAESLNAEAITATDDESSLFNITTPDSATTKAKGIVLEAGGNTQGDTSEGGILLLDGGQNGAGGIVRLRSGGGGGSATSDSPTIDLVAGTASSAGDITIVGGTGSGAIDNGNIDIQVFSAGTGSDGVVTITAPTIRLVSNGVTYTWPTGATAGANGTVLGISSGGGTTSAVLDWIAN
jgi:hypothetical protein